MSGALPFTLFLNADYAEIERRLVAWYAHEAARQRRALAAVPRPPGFWQAEYLASLRTLHDVGLDVEIMEPRRLSTADLRAAQTKEGQMILFNRPLPMAPLGRLPQDEAVYTITGGRYDRGEWVRVGERHFQVTGASATTVTTVTPLGNRRARRAELAQHRRKR